MDAARISSNLAAVRQRIDAAAGGRAVRLVCVTKYAEPEWVRALLDVGATELGESRLPEGLERFDQLRAEGRRFTAHLIGPLQSRKAPLAARCDLFQALERGDIAERLSVAVGPSEAKASEVVADPPRLDVLVQVNIGGERQKHGVAPEQLDVFVANLAGTAPVLRLCGLMCIPPGPDAYTSAQLWESGTRASFRQMRGIFDRIAASFADMDTLSMGMSQDFAWAIEEGSTMVRVGSALFDGLIRRG